MSNTLNKGLITPATGDLPGAWGTTAINVNMSNLDGILGGVTTLSLAGASTITLTAATSALTPSGGPTQQSNALIKFTGTLTGNNVINFNVPGFYIVENQCAGSYSFAVQLKPASGGGKTIGAPPGKKCHVFFDGTDMDYVDMPEVGAALDLHGIYILPVWMQACTVLPYLIKDGLTYSTAAYTALGALLGAQFGGNGVTTFGLPDERNRMRVMVDTNGPGSFSNRITSAGSGINGQLLDAVGGDERLQSHTHTTNDPGHVHGGIPNNAGGVSALGSFGALPNATSATTAVATTGITINTAGTGSGQNMPPTIVSILALIKT